MQEDASIEISTADLAARCEAGGVQVVDVRTDAEWAEERLADSRHINMNDLAAQAESIDRDQTVVFVCSAGNRSAVAAEAFRLSGFEAYSLEGGLDAWSDQGRDLETS